MKITKYEDREEWLEARRGKITGSRLKDLIVKRGTEMKKGYYELVAERLALSTDAEMPMDRGARLENEAIETFVADTNIKIITDLVIWERDDNNYIAISPDGYTADFTIAVEVKCLNSADHIKAFITQQVPKDYEEQVIQYFIVNDQLIRLYFVMYDPRMSVNSFFYLVVERSEIEKKMKEYLTQQYDILARVEATVARLTDNLF